MPSKSSCTGLKWIRVHLKSRTSKIFGVGFQKYNVIYNKSRRTIMNLRRELYTECTMGNGASKSSSLCTTISIMRVFLGVLNDLWLFIPNFQYICLKIISIF